MSSLNEPNEFKIESQLKKSFIDQLRINIYNKNRRSMYKGGKRGVRDCYPYLSWLSGRRALAAPLSAVTVCAGDLRSIALAVAL